VKHEHDKEGKPFDVYDFPEFGCQIHVHFEDDSREEVGWSEVVSYSREKLGFVDNRTIAMLRHYSIESVRGTIIYRKHFACALPIHRFEVYLDSECLLSNCSYFRDHQVEFSCGIGKHTLVIRQVNKLSRWRRKKSFTVQFPEEGTYVVHLPFNSLWGGFGSPEVGRS